MTNRYLIGNAQTIGNREIQSNYFATAYNGVSDLLAVLADGTIDHPNGRNAAVIAVECCVEAFTQEFSVARYNNSDEFLLETALKANKRIKEAIYLGTNPRLSLTMILLKGKELQYFNVGANKIFLYNGRNELILGNYANDSYSAGKYDLAAKNVIGILSTGAYIDAQPMERIRIIESKRKIHDKAQDIIDSVTKKGLSIQLNATALLIGLP